MLNSCFINKDSINMINRSKRMSDVQLESCIIYLDIDEVKLNIITEKSKKKNVPNKTIKNILNEKVLNEVRDTLNS